MKKTVIDLLENLGFKVGKDAEWGVFANLENADGEKLDLNFFSIDNVVACRMERKGLQRSLFDCYRLEKPEDLKFLILNNAVIKDRFPGVGK